MKVVLREHVDHLGERGEIVAVAAGYARNYLLPKRLAFEATPGNLKQILSTSAASGRAKEQKEIGAAQAMADRFAGTEVSVVKKAGEHGTLYGSVTRSEIAAALSAKGIEVDRRRIVLGEPIKALGSYDIPIRLHRKVPTHFKLHVVTVLGADNRLDGRVIGVWGLTYKPGTDTLRRSESVALAAETRRRRGDRDDARSRCFRRCPPTWPSVCVT